MPSSMIFASLVVLWLLILVPAVARHRQEVARPSVAALSGRVLARSPRRRSQEVDGMVERDETVVDDGRVVTATRTAEVRVPSARTELRFDDAEPTEDAPMVSATTPSTTSRTTRARTGRGRSDDRLWERPPARYRAGRGGFDAEAAALTARARYAFRQRVVLAMLVLAVATGVVAGCGAARALVGARGGRRAARRLPGVPAPPGADGGGHPGPPGGADGRHAPSVRRGRPRAGRLGRTRPGRHAVRRTPRRTRTRPTSRPSRRPTPTMAGDDGRRRTRRAEDAHARGREVVEEERARPPAPASDAAAPAPARARPWSRTRTRARPRRRRRARLPPCGRPVGGC